MDGRRREVLALNDKFKESKKKFIFPVFNEPDLFDKASRKQMNSCIIDTGVEMDALSD
jgi:hypothetical protein